HWITLRAHPRGGREESNAMEPTSSGGKFVDVRPHHPEELCVMPPSPELRERLKDRFESLRRNADGFLAPSLRFVEPDHVRFNDGLIYPGSTFPLGTPAHVARRAALERAP